jgi:predicted HicB family RNase H-like nuclease
MSDLPAHALGEIRDALADIVDRLQLLLPPEPDVEPKVRLTVDVPESLHSRIKVACARNNSTMNALILEAVHRALEHYEQEPAA